MRKAPLPPFFKKIRAGPLNLGHALLRTRAALTATFLLRMRAGLPLSGHAFLRMRTALPFRPRLRAHAPGEAVRPCPPPRMRAVLSARPRPLRAARARRAAGKEPEAPSGARRPPGPSREPPGTPQGLGDPPGTSPAPPPCRTPGKAPPPARGGAAGTVRRNRKEAAPSGGWAGLEGWAGLMSDSGRCLGMIDSRCKGARMVVRAWLGVIDS